MMFSKGMALGDLFCKFRCGEIVVGIFGPRNSHAARRVLYRVASGPDRAVNSTFFADFSNQGPGLLFASASSKRSE